MEEIKLINTLTNMAYQAIYEKDLYKLELIKNDTQEVLNCTSKEVLNNLFRNYLSRIFLIIYNDDLHKKLNKEVLNIIKNELHLLDFLKRNFQTAHELLPFENLLVFYKLIEIALKIHFETKEFVSRNNNEGRIALETLHLENINSLIEQSTELKNELKLKPKV